ncbi:MULTISPECIES: conjugal transfer protein TrbL [unclassified Microbacterium]|uniref:conjugal transfer protein TrbL n=1 Tax=unclassified Microbacterium TaxID=2609290 RepID=UPI000EAA576F|nr:MULTISPECIES: conjugal transfer protein TrbL [unclassified Microbacterium]MBT2486627.1 conjugal transfer protein TrbL [Microbacterium sp. ISL-108]RKN69312.1 conjugal transfer protein TrbL [Microbacterium sp. CGR2]
MAGICDVPIISNVCDAVGEGAATLVAAPFDWLAQAIGAAASWIFQGVWALFDSTTLVDITGAGYVGVYNVIFGIAIFVMLIFFCLQLITGLIRRDPTALSRAALGLAKSVLGSFLVITLTATLLEIVDQLSIGIIQATGTTLEEMGGKIGVLVAGLTAINLTAPGAGAIITIFLSFLAICAAAIVWFSLLIRKALILVAVVMAPIALSGASWDATKGWFGKWASFVLALIFSKLVIVVVFLVAINQVNAPIDMDLSSIADPIAGIVLMFIAAFAPYMVYKFISFVGFDMYHVMSAEQESKQAMNRPMPLPGKPDGGGPQKILDGGDGGKNDGGGGNPPPPPGGGPKAPPGGGGGAGAAGSSAGGSAAGGGAGAGAGAGAAAAGPVGIAAVAGAKIAKGAAEAGPKLGDAIGRAADGHAGAASEGHSVPPPPDQSVPPTQPTTPAPSAPAPKPQTPPAKNGGGQVPPPPKPTPKT